MSQLKFQTRAIHSGKSRDPTPQTHTVPIYQTATAIFDTAEELVEAYKTQHDRFFYSREGNPTVTNLEGKLSVLTGGEACLATASGMAAISTAVMSIAINGDHIIVSKDVFISSHHFFTIDCPNMGIEVSRVDLLNLDDIKDAVRPNTKLIYTETFVNPTMDFVDIKALRSIANEHELLLVVDNTHLSPYLFRPIELGADLVVHSATKYLSGHGDVLGGVVAGDKDLVMTARRMLFRFGQCLSPFDAWLILRGIRTLPLRMREHSANALALANFLNEHPRVEWVKYPSFPSQTNSDLARSQLTVGFGGLVLFKVPGGYDEMCQVMNSLKLATVGTSLGDLFTLLSPTPEFDNSIRVAVGCESPSDIIADFAEALEHA